MIGAIGIPEAIGFREARHSPSGDVLSVRVLVAGKEMGIIEWHESLRRYVFAPIGAGYDSKVLRRIADECDKRTDALPS